MADLHHPASTAPASASWAVVLPDEAATGRLAMDLAAILVPGDMVALTGDLGAGKTTLARALVREIAGDERLEVPSPTFNLMQLYDLPRGRLVHADLYRIDDPAELDELGWSEMTDGAITLVEWPEKAEGAALAPDRLDVQIHLVPESGPTARRIRLVGHGRLATSLQRMKAMRALIDLAGFGPAQRRHLQGDASTRAYERLIGTRRNAILMNAPRRPDGPPVRDGKPYSAIAHLAEDVNPFVAMARGLKARGFSIAVETNGTLEAPAGIDWICVSPKAANPVVQRTGQELKLVYPQEGVDPAAFEGWAFERFYLQPMDGPDRVVNTEAAIAYCLAHPRWRLSVQTHKYLGIP